MQLEEQIAKLQERVTGVTGELTELRREWVSVFKISFLRWFLLRMIWFWVSCVGGYSL